MNLWTDLPQFLVGELGRMFFKWSGLILIGKNLGRAGFYNVVVYQFIVFFFMADVRFFPKSDFPSGNFPKIRLGT